MQIYFPHYLIMYPFNFIYTFFYIQGIVKFSYGKICTFLFVFCQWWYVLKDLYHRFCSIFAILGTIICFLPIFRTLYHRINIFFYSGPSHPWSYCCFYEKSHPWLILNFLTVLLESFADFLRLLWSPYSEIARDKIKYTTQIRRKFKQSQVSYGLVYGGV